MVNRSGSNVQLSDVYVINIWFKLTVYRQLLYEVRFLLKMKVIECVIYVAPTFFYCCETWRLDENGVGIFRKDRDRESCSKASVRSEVYW